MKIIKSFGKGASANTLRLTLCDTNASMTEAWLDKFYGVDGVEILEGDLLNTDADAVVSPANSFGDMGGGVDKRIDDFFGGEAQNRVVRSIRERYYGEMPVGVAIVVPMPNARFPFLVAAPTMRIPGEAADGINAYLAMRGLLVAVYQHNAQSSPPIRSLAVSGLCTGVGGMSCGVSAHQMRVAYDNIVEGKWREVQHPAMAPFAFTNKRYRS